MAHSIGLRFERVVLNHRKPGAERIAYPAITLLNNMRQFVAEQLLALQRIGLISARCEIDVEADRKRDCADTLGLRSNMYSDIGEISAERRFHLAAHRLWQRLAASGCQPERSRLDSKRAASALALHRPHSTSKSRCRWTGRTHRR